ncbi:MAG TPA: nitrilase-related carbon-nitrogen hydrolase [Kofleriaceae bacterium]
MASAHDLRRAIAAVLAVALTAALGWLGTGLHPLWPLTWFASLPVLMFVAGASWWRAALAAAIAWLGGMLGLWHHLHDVLQVPGVVIAQFYGVETIVFTLGVLLYRALLRRGTYGWAVVAFPAVRVAFEYLQALGGPHGTFGSLAYTQVEFLPVLQLASVTGPWGITFLVLLLPAAFATAWQLRSARRRALWIAGAAVAAVTAVLALGVDRMVGDESGPLVRVGLVASDPPTSPRIADEGAATTALLDAYARSAEALAAQSAQLIVLPEKLGVVVDPGTRDADARFQALADRTRAVIAVGLVHVAGAASYNEARVYAPDAPVQVYTKHHLLPPFEPFQPGTALSLLPQPLGTWGVQICKDMDFPPLSRDYGRAGAALLLVPAWDFGADGFLHARMAVMRGVESGFSVVRAAKQGYLTVSDNKGRILAEAPSDAAPFATLVARVPAVHVETLYQRFGDWFAWLVLAGLAVAIRQIFRRRH